jgi:hypothetical protein
MSTPFWNQDDTLTLFEQRETSTSQVKWSPDPEPSQIAETQVQELSTGSAVLDQLRWPLVRKSTNCVEPKKKLP